jgi:S1-C subfamily serine protease
MEFTGMPAATPNRFLHRRGDLENQPLALCEHLPVIDDPGGSIRPRSHAVARGLAVAVVMLVWMPSANVNAVQPAVITEPFATSQATGGDEAGKNEPGDTTSDTPDVAAAQDQQDSDSPATDPATDPASDATVDVATADVAEMVLKAQDQRIEAIAKAVPTAVSVFVPGGAGGGSGVLISPQGYALTNFHVSSPAGSYMRCGLSDGRIYDAVIVGIDPVGDLALIQLLGRDDFPAAELGDSDRLQPGQWCFVVGNPFLLATNLQPTVTWGMLSGVHRYQYPSGTLLEYADCLQTDASINPGNSGGPIYDASGRLIGIVGRASFEKRGRVNVGVGYAISINQAKNFLGYLESGRIVDHATLGATVVTDPDGGVRVSNILESSDAYRRGLRYNDEIIEVAGRVVTTANDVQNILGTLPKGWRIPLAISRDGRRQEILVRLAGVHAEGELLEKMASALPPPPPAPPTPDDGEPGDDQPPPKNIAPKNLSPEDLAPLDGQPEAEEPDNQAKPSLKGADGKPIPESAAERIVAREGYANYFYNSLNQDRVFRGLVETSPQPGPVWEIRGTTDAANQRDVVMRIGGDRLVLTVGDREYPIESTADRFDSVDGKAGAAMLPALDNWRRMLVQGTGRFGDVFYLGKAPLLGKQPLRDVLSATADELESRFITDTDSGRLLAMELFADRTEDPAELIVQWPTEGESSTFPTALELRYGTEVYLRVLIDSWNVVDPAAPSS